MALRNRSLLSVVLALVMLIQGAVVAASPWSLPEGHATSPATAEAMPPCHRPATAPDRETDAKSTVPSCCDARCPSMSTCFLACWVVASTPNLSVEAVAGAQPPFVLAVRATLTLPSPLRPPIVSHG